MEISRAFLLNSSQRAWPARDLRPNSPDLIVHIHVHVLYAERSMSRSSQWFGRWRDLFPKGVTSPAHNTHIPWQPSPTDRLRFDGAVAAQSAMGEV